MTRARKTLYTLNVNHYEPAITALTFPLLEEWARKMGAEFVQITERKFPDMPVVYEKLQIKELAAARGDDWSIYVDADALIHPDMPDLTEHLPKDTVLHYGNDMATIRFTRDDYFRRDGRSIGSCNWFTIASSWCRDLWTPLDIPLEEALTHIFPTHREASGDHSGPDSKVDPAHLIDDYTLSRNIARFGLKFTNVTQLFQQLGANPAYAWHIYNVSPAAKLAGLRQVLQSAPPNGWGLVPAEVAPPALKVEAGGAK